MSEKKNTQSKPILLLLPSLSPTMETGKLVKWIKQEGDQIKVGEIVAEIETDKAVISMESGHAGKIVKILIEEGTSDVPVDEPIAVVVKGDLSQEEINSFIANITNKQSNPTSVLPQQAIDMQRVGGYKKPTTSPATETINSLQADTLQASAPQATNSVSPQTLQNNTRIETTPTKRSGRITISPYAKHIANTNSVDFHNIEGTGKDGTILARDVEQYMNNPSANSTSIHSTLAQSVSTQHSNGVAGTGVIISRDMKPALPQTLSGMRKAISRKVIHSKQTVPHFYVTSSINTSKLMEYKQDLLEKHQIKTTLNDWFMLATAKALQQVPQLNQTWEVEGESIIQHYQVDINCAIDVGAGPLLVLVPDVANQTIRSLHNYMQNIVQKAKDKTITPADLATGTFSISNLGMFKVHSFQAIINVPQVAVLAIGGSDKENQCYMTVSCDHRALDGRDAALFLQALRLYVEDPIMMITG